VAWALDTHSIVMPSADHDDALLPHIFGVRKNFDEH
jgi:hypothetical protein